MKQVINKNRSKNNSNTRRKKLTPKKKGGWHPKFGTSKLEEEFAENFLDKLGIEYIWQYEAKEIGRFYDFMCFTKESHSPVLLEIDGGYW